MKTTYREIIGAKDALGKLLDKQLRIKEAVALARLVKALNAELDIFGQEQRKIFASSTTPDGAVTLPHAPAAPGDGKGAAGLPEGEAPKGPSAEQVQKMEELLAVEVDVPGDKVTVTVKEIEAALVLAAEPFVEFEEAGD